MLLVSTCIRNTELIRYKCNFAMLTFPETIKYQLKELVTLEKTLYKSI